MPLGNGLPLNDRSFADKQVARLDDLMQQDNRLGELIPPSEKMTELLTEKRYLVRHEIGVLLAELAGTARRRGERAADGDQVVGPVETLLTYQYGPAIRGAADPAPPVGGVQGSLASPPG